MMPSTYSLYLVTMAVSVVAAALMFLAGKTGAGIAFLSAAFAWWVVARLSKDH